MPNNNGPRAGRIHRSMGSTRSFALPQAPYAPGDFVHHPQGFPIRIRRPSLLERMRPIQRLASSETGLCFYSDRYYAPGSELEVEIPLRGVSQSFRAEVVLVRELDDGYEIGVCLNSAEDAHRAKLVERICHTESQLKNSPAFAQ
ncbi:MAG: PilZ domain-containing protein [Pseudomonadota bacterium]